MLRTALLRLYSAATDLNKRNIAELVSDQPFPAMCDLGCDDGAWTMELAASSQSKRVFGIEIVADRARIARSRGIDVSISDLADQFPFEDGTFDLVHANQVIEHVADIDHFLGETRRVLRSGGTAVISTENGSSWHNIFAAAMGWQIFSLTNVSAVAGGVGNPLALHRGRPPAMSSWTHKTIFNYRGLMEILRVHRLNPVRVLGAGYYPLPAITGRIDVRHAHFITVKATKVLAAPGT